MMNAIRAYTRASWRAVAVCACAGIMACLAWEHSAAGEAESARIGYRFAQGAERAYKVQFTQEFEVKGYSFHTLVDFDYTEHCTESLDDTLFTIEIALDNVSAQMRRNDELMDVGVEKDLQGQTFIFKLNGHGMRSGMRATGYMENEKQALDMLKVMLDGLYPYLPDSTIGIGGEWTFDGDTSGDMKTGMDIESQASFKVKETKKEKNRACLLVQNGEENSLSGRVENQAGAFVMDGQGTGKGEFCFDPQDACIVKLKMESTAEITMIDASGNAAAERETYESHFVYTIKRELK